VIPWDKLERILVVRTDHIGDLVCSTPLLRTLRQRCPGARITAFVPRAAADVLRGNEAVDQIVTELPTEIPDLAIALAPRSKAFKLVKASGAPIRAGYLYPERPLVKLLTRWWLTERVLMPVRSLEQVPHEVLQLSRFGQQLGLAPSEADLEIPISAEDQQWGHEQAQARVGLHLSPGWLTHGWQLNDLIDLCRALPQPPLITCGPAERELAALLRNSGLQLFENLSLKRWAALLGSCSVVVSPDTGAVHVAAALRRPVVVCYQPEHFTLCSQQWHPWHVPQWNLRKGTPADTIAAVRLAVEEARQGA
jgi:heptosyltransferase-3